MIDDKRVRQARDNVRRYLAEGLLKRERHPAIEGIYEKNASISLEVADKLLADPIKPSLCVIVCSYYAMFYMANAALLHLGYRTTARNVHAVTADALIALVFEKLKRQFFAEFENLREDALDIAAARTENILESYEFERQKRSRFQYEMSEETKEGKAKTSLERAKAFVFELRKLMQE